MPRRHVELHDMTPRHDTLSIDVSIDERNQIAYLSLIPNPASKRQVVVDGDFVLDFDRDGKLVGIEVLDSNRIHLPERMGTK